MSENPKICTKCGQPVIGPFTTCSDCGMRNWRRQKQERIDGLLMLLKEAKKIGEPEVFIQMIERQLERERDWGD